MKKKTVDCPTGRAAAHLIGDPFEHKLPQKIYRKTKKQKPV